MKVESIISLSVRKRKKIKGKYRKQLYLTFDKIKYNKWNMVETMFSGINRKFGEVIKARNILQSRQRNKN